MLLADAAQAIGGKLYILGGGWSVAGPGPVAMAIALKIEVDWNEANRRHNLKLALLTEDDQPVRVPGPAGDQAVEVGGEFEVGRPPGLRPGSALDFTVAINVQPLPLPPDAGYVWRCWIDDHTQEEWRLTFTTRPAHPPVHP
jgi:hypothetical protein